MPIPWEPQTILHGRMSDIEPLINTDILCFDTEIVSSISGYIGGLSLEILQQQPVKMVLGVLQWEKTQHKYHILLKQPRSIVASKAHIVMQLFTV